MREQRTELRKLKESRDFEAKLACAFESDLDEAYKDIEEFRRFAEVVLRHFDGEYTGMEIVCLGSEIEAACKELRNAKLNI